METVIATVVGLVGGGLITFLVARRIVHRPKLWISLEPTVVLSPGEIDPQGDLAFSFGGSAIENLCVLNLQVACRGQKDIVVPDAAPPRGPAATPLPRIDFENFRIIGLRTLNNDASRFYIPLSRHSGGRGIYINVHHLRAKTTARFQIVGELEHGRRKFEAEQCKIFPGAIPDVDLLTAGAIHRPWLSK